MKLKLLLALAVVLPQAAFSATITGKLVDGGGGDYIRITVQDAQGKKVSAFCVGKCGDWFKQDEHEVSTLRKDLVGKKITVEYQVEKNKGRLESYGEDGPKLAFVTKATLLK